MDYKLGYICWLYIAALNTHLDNDSFLGTKGQMYERYFNSQFFLTSLYQWQKLCGVVPDPDGIIISILTC